MTTRNSSQKAFAPLGDYFFKPERKAAAQKYFRNKPLLL